MPQTDHEKTETLNSLQEADAALNEFNERMRLNQERKLEYIKSKISKKDIPIFANFAKTQVLRMDPSMNSLSESSEILNRLIQIASARVVPTGFSLVDLIKEFNKYFHKNPKGESGVSKMGKAVDDSEEESASDEDDDKKKNKTAGEGLTLGQIGSMVDSNRTFTPTAINNILNTLTTDGGKLDTLRSTLLDYLKTSSNDSTSALVSFDSALKRAVVEAAGNYIDYIEQARSMDADGNVVTLENLLKVLDSKKLRDSMSDEDKNHENLFLEKLIDYANDIEEANDEGWKDVVMEMISIDLLEASVFAPRAQLNIVKSFQNLVAEIIKPAPRRGRPPKTKS